MTAVLAWFVLVTVIGAPFVALAWFVSLFEEQK